ncbi:MAG: hypothetical protein HFJ80_08290 [Clostridiales bacterium]|nr:hypothetical protein [Clostridiales bacterium]
MSRKKTDPYGVTQSGGSAAEALFPFLTKSIFFQLRLPPYRREGAEEKYFDLLLVISLTGVYHNSKKLN